MKDHNTLRDEGVERVLVSEEELDRIVTGLADKIS